MTFLTLFWQENRPFQDGGGELLVQNLVAGAFAFKYLKTGQNVRETFEFGLMFQFVWIDLRKWLLCL